MTVSNHRLSSDEPSTLVSLLFLYLFFVYFSVFDSLALRSSAQGSVSFSPYFSRVQTKVDPNASVRTTIARLRGKFPEDSTKFALFLETDKAFFILDDTCILSSFEGVKPGVALRISFLRSFLCCVFFAFSFLSPSASFFFKRNLFLAQSLSHSSKQQGLAQSSARLSRTR